MSSPAIFMPASGYSSAMADSPVPEVSAVVLDCPDARVLGKFYQRLLGWDIAEDEPDWVRVRPPGGGTGLSFQSEESYQPPVWPATADKQQMMLHLDLCVEALGAAGAHAIAAGATLAEYQPQDDVRVYLDPAGHPFCLFLRGA